MNPVLNHRNQNGVGLCMFYIYIHRQPLLSSAPPFLTRVSITNNNSLQTLWGTRTAETVPRRLKAHGHDSEPGRMKSVNTGGETFSTQRETQSIPTESEVFLLTTFDRGHARAARAQQDFRIPANQHRTRWKCDLDPEFVRRYPGFRTRKHPNIQ